MQNSKREAGVHPAGRLVEMEITLASLPGGLQATSPAPTSPPPAPLNIITVFIFINPATHSLCCFPLPPAHVIGVEPFAGCSNAFPVFVCILPLRFVIKFGFWTAG